MPDDLGNPLLGSPEQESSVLQPVGQYLGDVFSGRALLSSLQDLAGAAGPNPLQSGLAGATLDPSSLSGSTALALGFGGMVKPAFHGTPHTFEPAPGAPFGEFKNDAIGTGEGAQAYGWGHYVAGNESVAEDYQRNLSGRGLTVGDQKWHTAVQDLDELAQTHAETMLLDAPINLVGGKRVPDFEETYNSIDAHIKDYEQSSGDPEFDKHLTALKNARRFIQDNERDIEYDPNPGNLLEVHILPEEHELLDWDRRFREQPESVQKALTAAGIETGKYGVEHTGETIYKQLGHSLGGEKEVNTPVGSYPINYRNDAAASAALHEAGVPGLRYLDADSRSAGEGTHNYVIFDPSNLRITARNGQRLEPVDHDPFEPAQSPSK